MLTERDDTHEVRLGLIGAAALSASCRTEPVVGPGVAIEVIEPCRQQGIATALLRYLERAAIQFFDAKALYAAQRVDQIGEATNQDVRAINRAVGIVLGWHERVLTDRNPKIRKHVRRFRRLDPFW